VTAAARRLLPQPAVSCQCYNITSPPPFTKAYS